MRHTIIVLTALATVACDRQPRATWPVRSDSAGFAQTEWGPADNPLDWSLEPVLDIGAESGPAAFGRVMPSGIGVDGARRIHVLDVLSFRVAVFDSSGSLLDTYGRSGTGPGEFRFPSDLAVRSDGATAVFDFDRRGFVLFDPDGVAAGDVPAPGPLMRRVAYGPSGILGAFRFTDGPREIRLVALAAEDTAAATLATIGELPVNAVDFGCGTIGFPPLLQPALVWASAGPRTAVATGVGYAIDIFDGTRRVARWSRAIEPLEATVALAAVELGADSIRVPGPGSCRIASDEAARRIGFAEIAPVVADLAISPEGDLWVLRRTEDGSRLIDVWSSAGDYLGTLPASTPFPAAFAGSDEVLTVERDAHGVAHVVGYRIIRP